MNINPAIFRAYDIRGVVTTDLRPEVVELIGKAFARMAKAQQQNQVVIGFDGRHSSPELAASLARGIQQSGLEVIEIGLVPTPVLYFATHQLKTGTGVMVTGSHNPPEYNGLKMMLAGKTLHSGAIQDLYQIIQNQDFISNTVIGSCQKVDVVSAYIATIAQDIKLGRALNFAYDCGNGAAGAVFGQLLAQLNIHAEGLYTEIDGDFPNHHPDPSNPANLADLIALVRAKNLDFGIAFDGDGDRLGVVDGSGNIIWADRQLMLFARDVLTRVKNATIVFDVKCSQHLPRVIEGAGGRALMGKTGHSFVKALMQQENAALGGEMSGHLFFQERWFGFDDGLYSAMRLLEILSTQPQSPSAVFATLPESISTPELTIAFAEGAHYEFIEAFRQNAQFEGAEVVLIDGLRANFANGFGLVRASNTTPSLVLRFEADTQAALAQIQQQFRKEMQKIAPDLSLPF